jgi:hypothetical protein
MQMTSSKLFKAPVEKVVNTAYRHLRQIYKIVNAVNRGEPKDRFGKPIDPHTQIRELNLLIKSTQNIKQKMQMLLDTNLSFWNVSVVVSEEVWINEVQGVNSHQTYLQKECNNLQYCIQCMHEARERVEERQKTEHMLKMEDDTLPVSSGISLPRPTFSSTALSAALSSKSLEVPTMSEDIPPPPPFSSSITRAPTFDSGTPTMRKENTPRQSPFSPVATNDLMSELNATLSGSRTLKPVVRTTRSSTTAASGVSLPQQVLKKSFDRMIPPKGPETLPSVPFGQHMLKKREGS